MKVMVIPVVTGAPGTLLKGLVWRLEELEIGGRTETITALFRSAKILRRVIETCGDLLTPKLQSKTIN